MSPAIVSASYSPTLLAKATVVDLGTHFAASAYQLNFLLSSAGATRPILSLEDLKSFDVQQSEFIEVKALGDIGERYPSLSSLYMGVLSKKVIVIPKRYAIVRDSAGCQAVCQALLDSASSAASKCKFEFTFVIAPEVSPVELAELSREVAALPEFEGYSITLPEHLSDRAGPVLNTAFQSSFQYSAGLQPHSFTLSVEIRDGDLDSPAVGNANLFLTSLATVKEPYLTGTLNLKLDDGYPSPVQSDVILNFAETTGTDELAFSVDEAAGVIRLINRSPLDLAISRGAVLVGATLSEIEINATLPGGGTMTLPLPPDHTGIGVIADSQIALPAKLAKGDLTRYLAFQVQDIQNTQFAVSINASDVDFSERAIDHIDVQLTFPALPEVTPAPLSFNRLHNTDGTQVLIPIQDAITQLNGTASFTIHFTDTQKPDMKLTLQNDFCAEAILVVHNSDLPA